MPPRAKNFSTTIVCLLLAAGTFALFSPVLSYEFVNYDDPDYAYENPMLQHGVTGEGIAWAFTKSYASNWHPLTWISHMVDWNLFGAKAGGHHFTSLLFHVANTLLLFLLLKRMTGALWRSALVAALFAFHPMRVESVAWVSERKDALSGFFFLLTVWAYARYAMAKNSTDKNIQHSTFNAQRSTAKETERGGSSIFNYFLALIFFALGLMSKPMLVTLPFVLLLLDFWPLRRVASGEWRVAGKKSKSPGKDFPSPVTRHPSLQRPSMPALRFTSLLLEKLPFFALTLISCVVTYFAQKAEAMERWDVLPLQQRLTNALISFVRYVGKTIWPTKLSVFYSYPDSWPMWQVVGAAVVLVAITAAVIWLARVRPWLAVGWFWFFGMLVPVIGIVQVGIQSIADRYVYLPGVGLLIALAWSLPEMKMDRWKNYFLIAASAVVVAACMILSGMQVRHWKNSETLFKHALKIDPENVVGHVMLASVLVKAEKNDEAINHYRAALKLKPGFAQMYYNIGNVLAGQKKWAEAAENYLQALQLRPEYPEAHYNLAIMLDTLGKFPEAAEHYAAALPSMPNDPNVRLNLGNALAAIGKLDEAIAQLEAALQLRPDSPEVHLGLGIALRRQKKNFPAADHFKEALRLKPDYAEAKKQLEELNR